MLLGLALGALPLFKAAPASARTVLDVTVTQLYCSDESGVDWWGSDEITLENSYLKAFFGDVDTGETYNVNLGPVQNGWISVREGDWGCAWFNVAGCETDILISQPITPEWGYVAGTNLWIRQNGYNVRYNAVSRTI
jgi:hypothetical protein